MGDHPFRPAPRVIVYGTHFRQCMSVPGPGRHDSSEGSTRMLRRIALTITMLAAAAVLSAPAPSGKHLTLGPGEYIDVSGPGAQITGQPITVQAWVRTQRPTGGIYACGFENGPETARQAGYALYIDFGGRARFGANTSASGFTYENWDNCHTRARIADGTWHHITGVFPADGRSRVRLYLDGGKLPDAELAWVGAAQPALTEYIVGQAPARIGAPAFGRPTPQDCFQGDLDEVRVWNVALTAVQIAANYDKAVAPDTPGLVSAWSFSGSDSYIRDTASGATGTRQRLPPEQVPAPAHVFANYPGGLTGWTGYDPDHVARWTLKPAVRQRVGNRGLCHPTLTRLEDGTLLLAAAAREPAAAALRFFQSRDQGLTWAETATAGALPTGQFPRFRDHFPSGILLVTLTAERRKCRWLSTDAGRSWKRLPAQRQPIPALPPASCTRLEVRRYLAALTLTGAYPIPGRELPWGSPQPPGDRSADHSVLVELTPGGLPDTGTKPRTFLNYSETGAHLLTLDDGRVLATYHSRHVPFGIMAVLSGDQGQTWDFAHPVYLARSWGPDGGWPTSVQLEDGSILTAYGLQAYRNEGADTVTEVVRWQLPPAGGDPADMPGIVGSVTFAGSPPDYSKYPAKLYGYSGGGRGRQQIAYLRLAPAQRTTIGHRGLYKGALARLPDGTLIATPSYRNVVKVYRSADDGNTWEFVDTPGFGGKEMGAAVLRDGTLLNLHGGGIYRTTDGGEIWDMYRVSGLRFGLVRNVVEQDDGSLLMVVGTGTYYDRKAPPSKAWRLVSRDGGRTWPEIEPIPSWDDPESMFDEAAMIRLPDGTLLAAGRVTDGHKPGGRDAPTGWPCADGSEDADHMMLMRSADDGRTWSEPWDFLDYSRPHAELLVLDDGRLLACYANYFLPFGVAAVISNDNGKTWSTDRPIYLAYSTRCYTGWPTSVQLADGSILTMVAASAYAGSQDFTRAETVRWQLPPRGQ